MFPQQYNYNYQCALQINKHVTSFSDDIKLCTLKDVPNDVNFTIMSDDKNSSSRGKYFEINILINKNIKINFLLF